MASQYHREWRKLCVKNLEKGWAFVHEDVVKPVLEANEHYVRCKKAKKNSGICGQVAAFEKYLTEELSLAKSEKIDYSETAYALWLLGIRCGNEYGDALHRRVNEFFKGSTYFDGGIAGFRQLLYEVHVMCRLVEVQISFKDIPEENQPDFLVEAENQPFYLEVKMPTANLKKCIKGAFSQIRVPKRPGAVVAGLDFLVEKGTAVEDRIAEAHSAVQGTGAVVALEIPAAKGDRGNTRVAFAMGDKPPADTIRRILERALLDDGHWQRELWEA